MALKLGPASLGIGQVPQIDAGDQMSIWLYMDDVDAGHAAGLAAGGRSESAPQDMPWGERVAGLFDPDGNLLQLGAPTPST